MGSAFAAFLACPASRKYNQSKQPVLYHPSRLPLPMNCMLAAGRDTVGSAGMKEGSPNNGENKAPLHRDDSTFGEYMAGLDSRSTSGAAIRRLNSSGTS